MDINFSPAQLGVITRCLIENGSGCCSQADVDDIVRHIDFRVKHYLGAMFYDMWVQEFVQGADGKRK